MFFIQPGFLIAAAVGTAGLMVLYWLFRRARIQVVSALFLFAEQEKSRKSGWKMTRLPLPLSFWLEALTVILLAVAAAGLFMPRNAVALPLTVILDDSASMSAHDSRQNARERALDELEKLCARYPGRQFRILLAGESVLPLGNFSDPRMLRDALKKTWRGAAATAALGDAIDIAALRQNADREIAVFSDRRPEPGTAIPPNLIWYACGRPLGNVGFTALGRLDGAAGVRVTATVSSFDNTPSRRTLTVRHTGRDGREQRAVHELTLAPNETRKWTWMLPQEAGNVRLELQPNDALSADDQAELPPEELKPLTVSFNVPDAQRRTPLREAFRHSKAIALVPALGELVVTDNPARRRRAGENVFYLNDKPPLRSFQAPFTMNRTHELLRGVNLDEVTWSGGTAALPGTPLILGGDGTALLSLRRTADGYYEFFCNLNFKGSTLQHHEAWPVLLYNLSTLLRTERPGAGRTGFRTGEAIAIRLPPGTENTTALVRDGRKFRGAAVDGTLKTVDLEAGNYELRDGEDRVVHAFRINFLNPVESDLRGAESGVVHGETDRARLGKNHRSLSAWAILAALATAAGAQAASYAQARRRTRTTERGRR